MAKDLHAGGVLGLITLELSITLTTASKRGRAGALLFRALIRTINGPEKPLARRDDCPEVRMTSSKKNHYFGSAGRA